eukprot:8122883-Alexandrium_andersonii.AAC.1
MSASLVGSEMCIRDRAPRCRSRRGSSRAMFGAWARRSRPSMTASGCTVSYTHLTLPTICSV